MIKLTIKTLQQKTFFIEVAEDATVLDLKRAIEIQEGFTAASQMLIFQGKILDDVTAVSSCNIKEKDFIVMMTKKKTSAAPSPKPAPEPVKAEETKTEAARDDGPLPTTANRQEAPLSEEHEMEILTLMEMGGFEREHVVKAMKAAFYNPDRAAEYLFSGNIPEPKEDESFGLNGNGLQALSFLKMDPQFQQLKAVLNRQPHLLPPLLQQIGSLINDNQAEFLALLEDEDGEGHDSEDEMHGEDPMDSDVYEDLNREHLDDSASSHGDEGAREDPGHPSVSSAIPHAQYIQVSSEEKKAIDRLVDLGFSRERAIEAYFACEKDESLAANYLFDHPPEEENGSGNGDGN